MKGLCISVVWTTKHYYLFDSHSRNERGECSPIRNSIILKFNSLKTLQSHMITNYLSVTDVNVQFEIQYIQVEKNNNHDFSKSYNKSKEKKCKATETQRK